MILLLLTKLALIAMLCVTAAVHSQSVNDTMRIDAPECGRLSADIPVDHGAERHLVKRLFSSHNTSQLDWGWHVAIDYDEGRISGSLINSQWVLTTTLLTE
jgi:hypothetical protein